MSVTQLPADPEDEWCDLRDALYDAGSLVDLRERVAAVLAFWRKRGSGASAANVMTFLDRLAFGEAPSDATMLELRATMDRLADRDPAARPYADALRE